MTRTAYLTIDDSPSGRTDDWADALSERKIPAMLFCRGDLLEKNPQPVIRAIQKGLVAASHGYHHCPAGELTCEGACDSIRRGDALVDDCYRAAGIERPGKYFRFPYIDRGDGDRLERRFFDIIEGTEKGENPKIATDGRVAAMQEFLKNEGFVQPFEGVTHPLYRAPEIAHAYDCLFTYSTGDWMLNARHLGKWPLNSVADLKKKMNDDPWLMNDSGAQIVLLHDHDEIFDISLALVDYMLDKEFVFKGTGT